MENAGWKVLILWECQMKRDFDVLMEKVVNELLHNIVFDFQPR